MTSKILKTQLIEQLHTFIQTNSSFKIVYNTSKFPNITSITKKILILDSSFNPPHKGHYSLISKSFKYQHYNDLNESLNKQNSTVLLLLSVKNVDKLIPKPASFENRLIMMCLLANHIEKNLGLNVSVGLTNHAKFIDKSNVIQNWINEILENDNINNNIKLTFLVGFDTIIRIFDEKYYKPLSLKDALDEFMNKNELFCLTRDDDKDFSLDDQINFLKDIEIGLKYPNIPKFWKNFIYLDKGDENFLNISSSSIRDEIINDSIDWYSSVIDSIKDYINDGNVYTSHL